MQKLDNPHTSVADLYKDWFLDYASYVILERAVPNIEDGLKPVQRRILHAMKNMDDGRFHKVANIIGQAMQFHPHGDASIGDALVGLGQKDLLVDTQGNWGDYRTGDSAAAPRYIESRLSKFALDVVFNAQTTIWQKSYDGRKKEPVTFPVKFPLLLAQGTEGIAVGLATKVMPHNFCELIHASIDILQGKPTNIMPDFPTGGIADCSQYKGGSKGGKIRVRARMEIRNKKEIAIQDVPFGVSTGTLIDSILKANEEGKIKIKKVVDNTAKDVEIVVELAPNIAPEQTIDALYAFTDCEVSISPNTCVIANDKPIFVDVNELLKYSTDQTLELLKKELEIKKFELLEKLLYGSLEKIFIENRIYHKIEECTSWESVLQTIDEALLPFKPSFYREIVQTDLLKLTEIRIKRISKYDTFKADEVMKSFQEELLETEKNLNNLVKYAINYFKNLYKKYAIGRERRTELVTFDSINANEVVLNNQKLYVNREDGFMGYGNSMKKDEFVCDCSDIDDVIVFTKDGKYYIKKIGEKVFIAKDILSIAIFGKETKEQVYHAIYRDGETGISFAKRFQVTGVIRDKEYDLTKGSPKSTLLYFAVRPQNTTEIVNIKLTASCTAKIKSFDYDFQTLEVKGKNSIGNIITKYPIRKVEFKKINDVNHTPVVDTQTSILSE